MKHDDYDASATLTLRGTGGLLEGETHSVCLGETVSVGRSRHCDFSLKKTRAYLLAEDREPLRKARGFRRISREHVRVAFVNEGVVEIEDVSRNGLRVDGNRVDRLLIVDIHDHPHSVDLGGGQTFEIRWGA